MKTIRRRKCLRIIGWDLLLACLRRKQYSSGKQHKDLLLLVISSRLSFGLNLWRLMEAYNVTYYLEQVMEQNARVFSNIQQGHLTVRELEQKFIQLERFAPWLCNTKRAWTNKFIWALQFELKDRVASYRRRTLTKVIAIACVSEEVSTEQYRPLNKMRIKARTIMIVLNSNTNGKPTQVHDNHSNKQNADAKRKRNDDEKTNIVCLSCTKCHTWEYLKSSNK